MGQNNVNTNNTNKEDYVSRKLDYNKPENRKKVSIERDYVLKNDMNPRRNVQIDSNEENGIIKRQLDTPKSQSAIRNQTQQINSSDSKR